MWTCLKIHTGDRRSFIQAGHKFSLGQVSETVKFYVHSTAGSLKIRKEPCIKYQYKKIYDTDF